MRRFAIALGTLLVWVATCAIASPVRAQHQMGDPPFNRLILIDELEYGWNGQNNPISWDLTSWMGGDWKRLWIKSEGELSTTESEVEAEAQVLYSLLIDAFWEVQMGVRADIVASDEQSANGRGHLALGLEGLAPYWFELEPAIFISHEGDISFRLHASYDLYITQRLLAHASFETNIALSSAADFGVGAGWNDIELGLRIGYQFAREFTPYIGVSWEQTFFETADLRRTEGVTTGNVQALAGLRFWF